MNLNYALEKYGSGTGILARHPGRIRERLIEAFERQILSAGGPDSHGDVPDRIEQMIREQIERVSSDRSEPTGALRRTVEAMSEEEAVHEAERVLHILAELEMVRENRRAPG